MCGNYDQPQLKAVWAVMNIRCSVHQYWPCGCGAPEENYIETPEHLSGTCKRCGFELGPFRPYVRDHPILNGMDTKL